MSAAYCCFQKKIYYHDTDAGGVVYYANYLKHLEAGRTQFCLEQGIDTQELLQAGVQFVVVHVSVDYKSPARYGDIIDIRTQVEKIGNSSVHFNQEIYVAGKLVIKAKVVWACVDRDFNVKSVPENVRKALTV